MANGSKPSPLSRKLARVREQLKSGKTRGRTPRDLTEAEVKALEDERDRLVDQMRTRRALRSQRMKLQSHVTKETNRGIDENKRHIERCNGQLSRVFCKHRRQWQLNGLSRSRGGAPRYSDRAGQG